jgi:hypothetical protein
MKNLIAAVIVILLAGLGIYMFMLQGAPAPTSALVPEGNVSAQGTAFSGRDFLRTLVNLQSLKLNDAIFSSAVFTSLIDFSVPLQPEPKGRANPFLPIGLE